MALMKMPTNVGGGSGVKIKIGTFNPPTSSSANPNYATVSCGFRPKYVWVMAMGVGSSVDGKVMGDMYNSDIISGYAFHGSESNGTFTKYSLPASNMFQIRNITSDGFEYNYTSPYFTSCWYIAIG
jgi:hypothetical protein